MRHFRLFPLAALLVAPSMASAQERVGRECRQEVVQLCGMTRDLSAIRQCLKQKSSELSASCRDEIRARIAGGAAARRDGSTTARPPAPTGATAYVYGTDTQQAFDYYPAATSAKAPLVIFIHGGGWLKGDKGSGAGTKPAFYNGLGYAFASANYRLAPSASPGEQATDIANLIAYMRRDAAKLGFDPDRIVVMGHSAGAHLAALVSSDQRYFDKAGVPMSAIRGTILLDGAGYDVPRQMADPISDRADAMYEMVFGKDPAVQKALSPITYVAAPNTANWLILFVASRDNSRAQSEALAKGLSANHTAVAVKAIPNSTHKSVNQDSGTAGTVVGNAIVQFLAALK